MAKDVLRMAPDPDMPTCLFQAQPWQLKSLCTEMGIYLQCCEGSSNEVHERLAEPDTGMTVRVQYHGDSYTAM